MLMAPALALSFLPFPNVAGDPPEPPNILVIVLDDVGLDKLEMYGAAPVDNTALSGWEYAGVSGSVKELAPITPVLSQIATQGGKFLHAYGSPVCSPSRAQMLSGGYGHENGMFYLSETSSSPFTLDPNGLTVDGLLPKFLTQNDQYKTGAFGKWHLTATLNEPCHPIDCGFQVFQGHMRNNELLPGTDCHTLEGCTHHFNWPRLSIDTLASPGGCSSTTQPVNVQRWDAGVTCDDARAFLDRFRIGGPLDGERFFAWVAINAPHQSFQVPPRATISANALQQFKDVYGWDDAQYDLNVGLPAEQCPDTDCNSNTPESFKRRLHYRAMLESVDFSIGRLLGTTGETLTDLENTVILVIGDNGTPSTVMQMSSAGASLDRVSPPYPAGHAKREVYEHGIRIPLLAYGPTAFVAGGGWSCTALVSTVDLWSTIAELSQLTPTAAPPSSKSFAYWLREPYGVAPPGGPRNFLYQEICAQNDFHWNGSYWTTYSNQSTGPVTVPPIYRTVISRAGWKFITRCAPTGATVVTTCPPFAACGTCFTPAGCSLPGSGKYEFYRVFGGTSPQPNEVVSECSLSSGIQDPLYCAVYQKSGP